MATSRTTPRTSAARTAGAIKRATAPVKRVAKHVVRTATRAQDAIALLRADHAEVSALFADYTKTRGTVRKQRLVEHICTALTVHTLIEEEIFYPAVERALKDKTLVPEAQVEHATLKQLISQLEGGSPGDWLYDARVQVLSEYVKHHVEEEHTEMFPKAKAAKQLDMAALGQEMRERKAELLAMRKEGFLGKIKLGLEALGRNMPPNMYAVASV